MTKAERRAIRRAYGEVANLTLTELRDQRDSLHTPTTANPDKATLSMADRLLKIQSKRASELSDEDHELVAAAVSQIRILLRQRPEGPVRHSSWRRKLLLLGHDPLRESDDRSTR